MHGGPQARTDGLIVEYLDDGLVIYDTLSREAHALDAVATAVLDAATGERSPAEIAAVTELDESTVIATLDQLAARGLLVGDRDGVSRRSMLRRTAGLGALVVGGAAAIDTVFVPAAVAHTSGFTPPPPPPPVPSSWHPLAPQKHHTSHKRRHRHHHPPPFTG